MSRKRFMKSVAAAAVLSLAPAAPAKAQTPGQVRPVWGDLNAFHGVTTPFSGDLNPFWGDINAFWGDINAFGDGINPFWGDINAFWGDINAFGGKASEENLLKLAGMLEDLIARSEAFWGAAVEAETGLRFREAFAGKLLSEFGIDLSDPSTLQGLSDVDRARFFFAWYDGLMAYSGRDHADHWMKTANWSPALTQIQGGGRGTVIGLVDFTVAQSLALSDSVTYLKGYDNSAGGHGSAVASLLVAAHDGRGLMGIAPQSSVVLSNPFDSSGTASWQDVAHSVRTVLNGGASVVNLSLGVENSTFHSDWRQVYSDPFVRAGLGHTVFVHAAGNDGQAQKENILWDSRNLPNFVVVGSVGPGGEISSFSNTPGTACFVSVAGGACSPNSQRLMDRFLVTSFSAPIVTGAVALMHTRWPWLKENPKATVDILLASAVDLGAKGTDPVYGRGLLNITGSQSPLNFDAMTYFAVEKGGRMRRLSLSNKVNSSGSSAAKVWGIENGYVVAFEPIGDTYRDFLIPLQKGFTGTSVAYNGQNWMLQSYLFNAFEGWVSRRFGDASAVPNAFGWDMKASFAPLPFGAQPREGELPYQTNLTIAGPAGEMLRVGNGRGASALSGGAWSSEARFSHAGGGLNPVLGLASGGAYAAFEAPLAGTPARFSVGMSERRFDPLAPDPYSPEERPLYEGLDAYRALAGHVQVTAPLAERLSISAAYTVLSETDGLLGVRALDPNYLPGRASTDAASLGLSWTPSEAVTLSGSATFGRTRPQDGGASLLTVADEALAASAYDLTLDVNSLFSDGDRMRLSLMQPLHVENGALAMKSVEVVDRETGEIGVVSRSFALDGQQRRLAAELSYATPVLSGKGEAAAFLRAETETAGAREGAAMVGGSFRIAF